MLSQHWRGVSLVVALLTLSSPNASHADTTVTGAGPFYDGVAHFFVSLQQALPVVALALLFGLQGRRSGRWVIAVLPLCWLAGALIGFANPRHATSSLPLFALLVVPCALAAWGRALTVSTMGAIAAVVGCLAGYVYGVGVASGDEALPRILGATASVFVVTMLVAVAVAAVRATKMQVVARMLVSLLAALGILAAGWLLRA
jgi:hydrogenase/urease accessory protein HupE